MVGLLFFFFSFSLALGGSLQRSRAFPSPSVVLGVAGRGMSVERSLALTVELHTD